MLENLSDFVSKDGYLLSDAENYGTIPKRLEGMEKIQKES